MTKLCPPLLLQSVLDLQHATPLQVELSKLLATALPIVVDGSQVERISTPCAQILLAALNAARSQGLSLELRSPSPSLADALTDLGLRQFFSTREA